MKSVIPTVFSHNKKEFDERFKKVTAISKKVQIDFMDGLFVPAKSVSLSEMPNLNRMNVVFEAHLMVKNPKKWLEKAKKKGFKKIIFHVEATKNEEDLASTIIQVKKLKMDPYIAINPNTSLNKIKKLVTLGLIEKILVMGVIPGKEHQELFSSIPKRIAELKKINPCVFIQIDGGVNDKTIHLLRKADAVNTGSFVSASSNPRKSLAFLKKKFNS